MQLVKNFLKGEEGATMIEYGLMVALIAVVLIVTISLVTGGLEAVFTEVSDELNGAAS